MMIHVPSSPFTKNLICLLFLGISSGVPFLLLLSTLSYWLNELGFSPTHVSLFAFITIPYSLKMFWAPFMEKYHPFSTSFKRIHHYKIWGFLAQFFLCLGIFMLSLLNPQDHTVYFAGMGFLICFFAATQDVIIDGLRVKCFYTHHTGTAASFSAVGFHLGKLASGCGTLYLAHCYDWAFAYKMMVLGIVPGILALFMFDIQHESTHKPNYLKNMTQHIRQYPYLKALLGFILFYKMTDAVLQGTSATFLYGLGLSKIEFANLTKVYGTVWTIIGALIAGFALDVFGLITATLIGVVLQILCSILFGIQAYIGYQSLLLSIVIAMEHLTSGFIVSTFIAFLSKSVNKDYGMSHYTLFYAIGSLSRVVVSAVSGYFGQHLGWGTLYFSLVLFNLPILYFIYHLKHHFFHDKS